MLKTLALLVGVAALGVPAAAAAPTTALALTTVSVSGTQTVVDDSAGIYTMHGSLVGKWLITQFVPRYESDSELVGSGRERFFGCLDVNANKVCDPSDPAGRLSFTFIYWASFDPSTGALIRGECVHPVTGGTGAFAGAQGNIIMHDKPVGDGVRTTYAGTLAYGGGSVSKTSKRVAPSGAAVAGSRHRHAIC